MSIPREKLDDLLNIVEDMLGKNVVAVKAVRQLAGKSNHFASLVYIWRPFLSDLWGALQEAENPKAQGHAPNGCIWVRQIRPALLWFRAFLHGRAGSLQITYRVSAYKNCGDRLRIVGDASIFGLGAYLMKNDQIVSWYASPITHEDEVFLGVKKGDETCQQVLECLNMLVALRTWKNYWRTERVSLEVRADNMAALTLVMSLKGKTKAMNQVARELALELGDAAYKPDIVTHTPGVASSFADTLSRRFSPTTPFRLPMVLEKVPEIFPAVRGKIWWRSLDDGRSTLG